MDEQLYFVSPFGLEHVRAQTRYTEGWGWSWNVSAWDGVVWSTIDSGYSRSDRKAIRAIAEVMDRLAEYEDIDGLFDDAF